MTAVVASARRSPARPRGAGAVLSKCLAIAAMAFRERLRDRAVIVGRVGFYFLVLLVFARLWQAVLSAEAGRSGSGAEGSWQSYVWYLAVTEWIMLSLPLLYQDIERDVRSGDIAYHLTRPLPYLASRLAQAVGDLSLRLLTLAPVGVLFARLASGGWPSEPWALLWVVPIGLLASLLMLSFHCCIGLTAFWLQDCTPVYLVWQKLAFVLGGLMLPLSIYPGWLQSIALASPFAAMLYGPGRLVLHGSGEAFSVLAQLSAWLLPMVAVVAVVQRRAARALDVNGG